VSYTALGKHLNVGYPRGGKVVVKSSPGKGRGVFAEFFIPVRSVIEVAPVIPIPASDAAARSAVLDEYKLAWGEQEAIGLGFASMYNHSDKPNAERVDVPGRTLVAYIALRDIKAGEEITVTYRCKPWW